MTQSLYVETSALLRVVLEGDQEMSRFFADAQRLIASELTFVESGRALIQAKCAKRITEYDRRQAQKWLNDFEDSVDLILCEPHIFRRAKQAFPVEPVRTLDAIHLASIVYWDEHADTPLVASYDKRVRENVTALGFELVC